jgi:ABC-type uncharacterized transport system permease subunit
MDVSILLASVLAASPPIVFAVLGETITEKAGVINLSLDGSLLLSAMAAFVVALETNSLLAGFAAGMIVGGFIALIIAFVSLTLYRPQVATGFVLTLVARDLAYVLGNSYAHVPGPQVPHTPIPGLERLPEIGPILFHQNPIVYLSLLTIIGAWVYLSKTQSGLKLQGLGDRPAAAFARGVNVTVMRYVYTLVGGALVGLGGASFSLLVKPGWARPYGIEGTGWIALAIVIFGGWRPIRGAVGAYFFVGLQTAVNLRHLAVSPDDSHTVVRHGRKFRRDEPGSESLTRRGARHRETHLQSPANLTSRRPGNDFQEGIGGDSSRFRSNEE